MREMAPAQPYKLDHLIPVDSARFSRDPDFEIGSWRRCSHVAHTSNYSTVRQR